MRPLRGLRVTTLLGTLWPALAGGQTIPPPAPPAAPTCEERVIDAQLQLTIVRQIRDQLEAQLAAVARQAQALAEKVSRLEATAPAPAAAKKP